MLGVCSARSRLQGDMGYRPKPATRQNKLQTRPSVACSGPPDCVALFERPTRASCTMRLAGKPEQGHQIGSYLLRLVLPAGSVPVSGAVLFWSVGWYCGLGVHCPDLEARMTDRVRKMPALQVHLHHTPGLRRPRLAQDHCFFPLLFRQHEIPVFDLA